MSFVKVFLKLFLKIFYFAHFQYFCVNIYILNFGVFMEKTMLKSLLYQHIDGFEIVNVSYSKLENKFEFLLREFSYVDDKIQYLNTFKKLIMLDKYGFCYYEDSVFHNTFKEEISRIVLEDELISFNNFTFSKLQKDWINILKNLGEFDEKEFKNYIFNELRKITDKENLIQN